jgi:ABC-type maltose transport system permease subunit
MKLHYQKISNSLNITFLPRKNNVDRIKKIFKQHRRQFFFFLVVSNSSHVNCYVMTLRLLKKKYAH